MHEAHGEHNGAVGAGALVGLFLAGFGIAVVALAATPFAPSPAECLAGSFARQDRHAAAIGGAVVAALLAALAVAVVPWSRRGGVFGAVAVVALAAGLPLVAEPWLPANALLGSGAAGVGAAALGAGAAPLLRERGLLSLALVSALAGLPHLWALNTTRTRQHENGAMLSAMRAAEGARPPEGRPDGAPTIAFVLGPDVDEEMALALAHCLRPPLLRTKQAVLAVRAGTSAEDWLLRLQLPTFAWTRAACAPHGLGLRAAPLPPPSLPVTGSLVRPAADGPPGIAVSCEGARPGWVGVVFTPAGEYVLWFGDDGRAGLSGDDLPRFRRWLATVPSGEPIRVLVVPPDRADAYGSLDLQT